MSPLCIMGDTNTQHGSSTSDAVGGWNTKHEDEVDGEFHGMLIANELFLPATFHQFSRGVSDNTHAAIDGSMKRLDHIAVPSDWQRFKLHSWVDDDVDLSLSNQDHFMVAVSVEGSFSHTGQGWHERRRRRYDKASSANRQHRAEFKDLLEFMPKVPWEADVHSHATTMTAHFQYAMEAAFPITRNSKPPKKSYLSEGTWLIICSKRWWSARLRMVCHIANLHPVEAFNNLATALSSLCRVLHCSARAAANIDFGHLPGRLRSEH